MIGELPERVATRIPGLDTILEGGFLRGGVYIIEGPPGVGKTTLGSHFCFNFAAAGGRTLYVTLLAESHTRLLAHLRRMHFFDPSVVPERVSYISAFKVLEAEGIASLLKLVRQTITNQKIGVVVLDGLISAEEASPTAKDFKKFLHEFQVITAMVGCTALLLNSTERPGGFRPERTMVDGIIELDQQVTALRAVRYLTVCKMRGASPISGRHHMRISDAGICVLPRIETAAERLPDAAAVEEPSDHRHGFGVSALDQMMQGGLPTHSVTAVVGPSGSGKTILGLHFLHEGAQRGEPGIYFGFFERPAIVRRKCRRVHLALDAFCDEGTIELHWHRPVESIIDELVDSLLTAVSRSGAKRLVLDGLEGLRAAAENVDRLREVMSCLCDALENLGVTTVYTTETSDLFGENLPLSLLGMSALTHNILLLKHIERTSTTQRTVTVIKLRDSGHDLSVRPFAITDRGIIVEKARSLGGPARAQSKPPSTRSRQASASPARPKGRAQKQKPRA